MDLNLHIFFIFYNSFFIPLFRDSTRTITSLPVSPSSSPLRQHRPIHNSPFFSPPHPSYAMMGQSSYTLNNMHKNPARSNATLTLDPWLETSRYKAHTPPGGSPRMRFIWVAIVNTSRFPQHAVLCGCWPSKYFGPFLYTWEPYNWRN